MNILHIIQNALPYISGSTIRSKYIFKYQKRYFNLVVFSTNFYHNQYDYCKVIDDLYYYRLDKKIATLLKTINILINRFGRIVFKFINFDIGVYLNKIFINPFLYLETKKLLNFYKIDVIHVHSLPFFGKVFLKLARKKGIPLVYEVRGFHEFNLLVNTNNINDDSVLKIVKNKYTTIRKNETYIMKNSDLLITLSDSMKDEIIKRGIDEDKIKLIPNCADFDKTHTVNEYDDNSPNGNNNNFLVGFIGRISRYEGIEVLIRAIPYILKVNRDIKLLIIGSGDKEYIAILKDLISKLKVNNYVNFIGRVPHEEIQKYYSKIDIIVLPRLKRKVCEIVTPLKPVEAFSYKSFVIASDLPALRFTIKPGKTGDLFEPENYKDLANKILYYMQNPEKRKRIEQNAFNYGKENFSWDKTISRYQEIYKNLIDK